MNAQPCLQRLITLTVFTRGALALCALMGTFAFAPTARATPVSFWFSGTMFQAVNNSNTLPAGITVGAPFTGYIYFESTGYASSNLTSEANGDLADFYFNNAAAFKYSVQVGGHTISVTNIFPGNHVGLVEIHDGYGANDAFYAETSGAATFLVDGAEFSAGNSQAYLTTYLRDNSKTAYTSVALPTNAPSLAGFPNTRTLQIFSRHNLTSATMFNAIGEITSISATEQVMLNLRQVSPTQLRLAWPRVASGFTLQLRTNLTTDIWQDVAAPVVDDSTDHTVTLPLGSGARLFRLKK